MKTDNFESESCRVTEDDSNDEKSETEVDSCVKGSRTRKAVPPPEDKILLEPLRGVLINDKIKYACVQQQQQQRQLSSSP